MLELKNTRCVEDKKLLLESFNPKTDTWLVSDLRSKFEIQKRLLEKHSVLPEDSVLRVNELWLKMAKKWMPSARVVSTGFMEILMTRFLKNQEVDWARPENASLKLINVINQFLPIYSSDELVGLAVDWLKENESSAIRWGHWFSLGYQAWLEFSGDELLTPSWLSGVLSNAVGLENLWDRNLIVDLGADLSSVEGEIFSKFSQRLGVTVLCPQTEWSSNYSRALIGYSFFDEYVERECELGLSKSSLPRFPDNTQIFKYTTMIAEVKAAVSYIRQWLDEGIPASEITLLAPDVELYWLALSDYLSREGVPHSKDELVNLQSVPVVGQWLSRLRIEVGELTVSDLEKSIFLPDGNPLLSFEKFRSIYSLIYDIRDLGRIEEVKNNFECTLKPNEEMDRRGFLSWSVQFWDGSEVEHLELLVQRILSEAPANLYMSLEDWLMFSQKVASQIEIKIEEGISSGVQILNLSGLEWCETKRAIVLGLVDGSDSESIRGADLNLSDIQRIKNDLGVQLSYPDNKALEFKIGWMFQNKFEKIIISVPATDFSGKVLSPSRLWINEAIKRERDIEAIDVPPVSRWDEIQRNYQNIPDSEKSRAYEDGDELLKWVELELNGEAEFGDEHSFTLSASKLEDYARCPFIFAAKHLFSLDYYEDLDFDLDRMSAGKFMHRMFELIKLDDLNESWTEKRLDDLVERVRKKEKLSLIDERLWPSLKEKYIRLAVRFIEFESNWRSEYPETSVLGAEVSVNGFWDPDSKELVPKNSDANPMRKFRGQIDRIDEDGEGNLLLIDYKSSGGSIKNYGGWVEHDSFQMTLYKNAIEQGLAEGVAGRVISASYVDAKNMERTKGFGFKEFDGKLFKGGRAFSVEEEKFNVVEQGVMAKVSEIIVKMESGEFQPNPDIKTQESFCPNCDWKKICRAKHLS